MAPGAGENTPVPQQADNRDTSAATQGHRIKLKGLNVFQRMGKAFGRGVDVATIYAPDAILGVRNAKRAAERSGGGIMEVLPASQKGTDWRIDRRRQWQMDRMRAFGGQLIVQEAKPAEGGEAVVPVDPRVAKRRSDVINDVAIGAFQRAIDQSQALDKGAVGRSEALQTRMQPVTWAHDNGDGTWTIKVYQLNGDSGHVRIDSQTGEPVVFPNPALQGKPEVARFSVAEYKYKTQDVVDGKVVAGSDSLVSVDRQGTKAEVDILDHATKESRAGHGVHTEMTMHDQAAKIIQRSLNRDSTNVTAVHTTGDGHEEKIYIQADRDINRDREDRGFYTASDEVIGDRILEDMRTGRVDVRGTGKVVILNGPKEKGDNDFSVHGADALEAVHIEVSKDAMSPAEENREVIGGREVKVKRSVVTMSTAARKLYDSLPTEQARARFRRDKLGERLNPLDGTGGFVRIRINDVPRFTEGSKEYSDDNALQERLHADLVHYRDAETGIAEALSTGEPAQISKDVSPDPVVLALLAIPGLRTVDAARQIIEVTEGGTEATGTVAQEAKLTSKSEYQVAYDRYNALYDAAIAENMPVSPDREARVQELAAAMHRRNVGEVLTHAMQAGFDREGGQKLSKFRDGVRAELMAIEGMTPEFADKQIAELLVDTVQNAAELEQLYVIYGDKENFDLLYPKLALAIKDRKLSNDPMSVDIKGMSADQVAVAIGEVGRRAEMTPATIEALVKVRQAEAKGQQLTVEVIVALRNPDLTYEEKIRILTEKGAEALLGGNAEAQAVIESYRAQAEKEEGDRKRIADQAEQIAKLTVQADRGEDLRTKASEAVFNAVARQAVSNNG